MQRLICALALLSLAAAPALAAETASKSAPRAKKDPKEVICKVQNTTAGIPTRVCNTRAEWEQASMRTRTEFMLTQRPMCGIAGGGC